MEEKKIAQYNFSSDLNQSFLDGKFSDFYNDIWKS